MANDKATASVTAIQIAPRATLTKRDAGGRFLTGNKGGGRPKGSRNKLTETFLETIANDFAEHGAEAIRRVRDGDPVTYLRIISSLLPRELIVKKHEQGPDIDYAELTEEQVIELLEAQRRRTLVERALKSLSGT